MGARINLHYQVREYRRYSACPRCTKKSIRVNVAGRIVRHTEGFGSVERPRKGSPKQAGPICTGSGGRVEKDLRLQCLSCNAEYQCLKF